MTPRGPLAMSAASGAGWAVIGLAAAFIGYQPTITLRQALLLVAGGAIGAPLIGVLMGLVSRRFGRMPGAARVLVAGASLYVATFLFVAASGVFPAVLSARISEDLWFNSAATAWASLAWTGFGLELWALAYASHAVISRAWERRASMPARS